MRKRVTSAIIACAMLIASLAACGGTTSQPATTTGAETTTANSADAGDTTTSSSAQDTTTAANGEVITLKWAIWDLNITPYWIALKDAFEAKNPNIKIEMVDLGSTDYDTILSTQLSGNTATFDVVSVKDIPGYATLVQKNVIEPLDSYVSDAGIDLSVYGGATDQIIADGKLFQLPFRKDFWVIYYNKDIFDRAGVAYPTNDMTYAQYDELARQVASNEFGAEVYGSHYHTWRSTIQLFGITDGKNDILSGTYDFLKPYYEMVLAQEKDKITRSFTDLKTEGLHYSAAFSSGNVAMMNMGSWFISTMIANLKSGDYDASLCGNWGVVKYPHAEGVEAGSTFGTLTGLAITTGTPYKDAAWEFVKFAGSEEGAKVMAETGNFPAIMTDEAMALISGLEGFPSDPESKEALQVSNLYLEVPYHSLVSEINAVLDAYHASIMSGEMTIDEGLAAMNTEVGKVLGQ